MIEIDNKELLPYKVGGLLYTPAVNGHAAEKLICGETSGLFSAAFCLEDAISDDAVEEGERVLRSTLERISERGIPSDKLPLMFARVRGAEHMKKVDSVLGEYGKMLTGYILPKFDLSNGRDYLDAAVALSGNNGRKLYVMPILESEMLADCVTRRKCLEELKELMLEYKEYILNVRVGGNDFCNLYGLRRNVCQTVYDVGVVRDILIDILNVFAADFVVSGPVWEYFGRDDNELWAQGLRKELELDKLNGFIGKTAVHPSQLPIIAESLKPDRADYEDAVRILGWTDNNLGVAKSVDGGRMNEVKCHTKWAKRICALAECYGVKER